MGLIIAILIIVLWSLNTSISLSSDLSLVYRWELLILILGQTFLNTGLFITAHDAMHGSVAPSHQSINNSIGTIAVNLYGLFSYQKLKKSHLLHHLHPATDLDPDYHRENHASFWSWYGEFMSKYISYQQLLKIFFLIFGLVYVFKVSWLNLILCWALPLILSSLQLFTFGTFFPHRRLDLEKNLPSIATIKSLRIAPVWSFLACYNFSYHWEHHQYPHLPWWRLSLTKLELQQ